MSEKDEKIFPVKEKEDGSAIAAIEAEEELEVEEKAEEDAEEEEHHDEEASADEESDDDSGDERDKIREARRKERNLKKELARQREISAKNKIAALERRNEELARRVAAVENTAVSYQFAQVDKAIEDEATRVEYAKMKLLEASQQNNAAAQVQYLEQLQDAKTRLGQIQALKKQQLEEAKRPRQNVPNPVSNEVQQNAQTWLSKNKWYDPGARDTDSKIAKVIDQELAADGWDPSDQEYWNELDNRLKARLPHRYSGKAGQQRNVGPQGTNRTAGSTVKSANTITLSRERVNAIKDAGAWDNPAARAKMIKAYAKFDRENRNA